MKKARDCADVGNFLGAVGGASLAGGICIIDWGLSAACNVAIVGGGAIVGGCMTNMVTRPFVEDTRKKLNVATKDLSRSIEIGINNALREFESINLIDQFGCAHRYK